MPVMCVRPLSSARCGVSYDQAVVLALQGTGDTLGERSLDGERRQRDVTARCTSPTHLLKLSRDDYHLALGTVADRELRQRVAFLRHILLLQGLSDSDLSQIARIVTPKSYPSSKVLSRRRCDDPDTWLQILVQQDDEIEEILFIYRGYLKGVFRMTWNATAGESHRRAIDPDHHQHIDPKNAKTARYATSLLRVCLPNRMHARRGVMTLDDGAAASYSDVPKPPTQQGDVANAQPRFAQLVSKHRQHIIGNKTSSASASSCSFFQITMAAMHNSKANQPPRLTQEDLTHLTNPVSITKAGWRFVEVHFGKTGTEGQC